MQPAEPASASEMLEAGTAISLNAPGRRHQRSPEEGNGAEMERSPFIEFLGLKWQKTENGQQGELSIGVSGPG